KAPRRPGARLHGFVLFEGGDARPTAYPRGGRCKPRARRPVLSTDAPAFAVGTAGASVIPIVLRRVGVGGDGRTSVRHQPAVDDEVLSRDRTCPGGGEVQGRVGELLGADDPPQRGGGGDHVEHLLRGGRTGVRGTQQSTGDHVDGDAVVPQVVSESTGQGEQRRFGGRVVVVGHHRVLEQIGSHVDD